MILRVSAPIQMDVIPTKQKMPILKKPTASIQLRNPLSNSERKLLNTLLFNAQNIQGGYIANSRQEISLSEVFKSIGWDDSHNIDGLKSHMEKLMTTIISWNEFGEDRSRSWEACTFITYGKIKAGTLTYAINERIEEEMVRPRLFGKVQLLAQSSFSKRYSLIIYEYLQDMIGRRKETNRVSLEYLRSLTNLQGDVYQKYKYFRRDVLQPATDEINRYSDLEVSFIPIKEGRTTKYIEFQYKVKINYQSSFDFGEGVDELYPVDDVLVSKMIKYGLNREVSIELINGHGKPKCLDGIKNLEEGLHKNGSSIQNTGGWLRDSIVKGWENPKGQHTLIDDAAANRMNDDRRNAEADAERDARLKRRYDEAKAVFDAKTEKYKAEAKDAFLERLRRERRMIELGFYKKVVGEVKHYGPALLMLNSSKCY